jgi:hypothetical protein
MMTDPLKRIPVLYHFTDRRNLDLIRELGGLHPLAELKRKEVEIPAPGGNEWSQAYPIKQAAEMIDFEVLYTRTDWKDPLIRQRLLQAEKCEVLVPRLIPLDLIRNFPHG